MKRWTCPNCHGHARAPSRPRKDDVRRYCLDCSKVTGRLVERVCIAQVRKRETAQARRRARRQRDATLARERVTIAEVHVPTLARKCWRALAKLGYAIAELPTIRVKHTSRGTRGWAYSHSHAITVFFQHDEDCGARVRELVLHELCHIAVGCGHQHDEHFNGALGDAANALWGYPRGGGTGYRATLDLEQWLRDQIQAGVALNP